MCRITADEDVKYGQIKYTDECSGGRWTQIPSFPFFFFFSLIWLEASTLQVTANTCRTTSIMTCFKMPQHILPSIYSIVSVRPQVPANQIKFVVRESPVPKQVTHSRLPKSAQTAENANRSPWRAAVCLLLPCILEQSTRKNPQRQVNARIKKENRLFA